MKAMTLTPILIALFSLSVQAAPHTSLLGSTELFKDIVGEVDADVIDLGSCGPGSDNPAVQKVQVRVKKNDVKIQKLVATFGNGQKQEFQLRENFAAGSTSRWIDLNGNTRCIEKIRVVGNTITDSFRDALRGPTAVVEIWGQRAAPPARPIKQLAVHEILSAGPAPMTGQSFEVDDCQIKAIRIKSQGGRLKIKDFYVIFGNNQTQEIAFKAGFFTNQDTSQWKDLNGQQRCIKAVVLKAMTPNNAKLVLQGR